MKPTLIVCMGVSSCGKSTVGRAIARSLDVKFFEADDFHSRENQQHMASGLPLTDAMRAPWIDAICRALKTNSSQGHHAVLACSALRRAHRKRFRECGFTTRFLFLDGSHELIAGLIQRRKEHFMPPELLASQFAALESPLEEGDVTRIQLNRPWNVIYAECLAVAEGAINSC